MSRRERAKGLRGEAEVRAIYQRLGFEVRGLEGTGDHLAIGYGLTIHSEVKRQEVLRLPLWTRQAWNEAPAGAIPVVAYRQSHTSWKAAAPASHIGIELGEPGWACGFSYRLQKLNDRRYAICELESLLVAIGIGREAAERVRAAQ